MKPAALTFEEFGAGLLKTEDLDPVYCALVRAPLDSDLLSRISLAYWCLYSLGAACKIAEASSSRKYWDLLSQAARNDNAAQRWPRGAERRHWRGAQAISSAQELSDKYKHPEQAVATIFRGEDYEEVAVSVQQHRGFGPWIAWKIADMKERVFGQPVDFSSADLGIYKDPRQGLALFLTGDWRYPITDDELRAVVAEKLKWISKFKAPPQKDRRCNLAELETWACKAKSYHKGHYWVGKDIHEVRHGLRGWGRTADLVLQHMPEEVSNA